MTRVPVELRFWQYVNKSSADSCWLWNGSLTTHGYGQLSNRGIGHPDAAHRVSFRIHHGPIPDGQVVRHTCDMPACVNPAHLELGTKLDNSADMVARNRSRFGERHWRSRLTAKKVLDAKRLATDRHTFRAIAKLYNVHPRTIEDAVTGVTWKRLTDHSG